MGVSILSYELSQYFDKTGNLELTETPALLTVQTVLYYTTQIISFLINPIIMEYKKVTEQEEKRERMRVFNDFDVESDSETELTCCSRLKKALCNQLKNYLIMFIVLTIALFFVVYFNIDIMSFKEYIVYLPAISNVYGLILFSVTIGSGLSQIPLSIWRRANPVNSIRNHMIQLSEPGVKKMSHFDYLIAKTKGEYKHLRKMMIKKSLKEKCRFFLFRSLSLFCVLISLRYLGLEISYSVEHSGLSYLLNIVNNEFLNHVILFIFIGFVTLVGGYILTCLAPGSMVNDCCNCRFCRSCLLKCFDILRYKFEPKNTASSTFGFWSTYFQRLVPTIAYHCQQMAGSNESSLEQIIGKLDQFNTYTLIVKSALPLMLGFVAVIAMCCGDSVLDREKIRRGLDLFKEKCAEDINFDEDEDDFIVDQYIVDDSEITEEESSMYKKHRKNKKKKNDLEEPLNKKLNDYHKPSPEIGGFNDNIEI